MRMGDWRGLKKGSGRLYGDKAPRHARRFAEVGATIEGALKAYVAEGGAGAFPTDKNSARMDGAILAEALR